MLNTPSFKFMRKWGFVDELYTSLNGFCEDKEDFIKYINNIDSFLDFYDTEHNTKVLQKNYTVDAKNNFLSIFLKN